MEKRPAILLVDDNPHDVVLLRLAFRRVGIIDPIKLVKNGLEAIRYLKGEDPYTDRHQFPSPTLMLLDLNMPQTSGFDVLEWARKQSWLDQLAVVVLTGSNDSEDITRAYQLGADSYLVKPARFADLVQMTHSLKSYCSRFDQTSGCFSGSHRSVSLSRASSEIQDAQDVC
jgi:CheY-like chemotaxis protein